MKAKDLKNNKSVEVELGDKKYSLNFDFNTYCKLEELGIYNNAQEAFDDLTKGKFTAIRALIWASINAETNKDIISLLEVGKKINNDNIEYVMEKVHEALDDSMPEKEEDTVEEDKEEKN